MEQILGIVLLYSIIINAQSFKLGFDLDTQLIMMKSNDNSLTLQELYRFPPQTIHLILIYAPVHKILIQLKIGRDFDWPAQEFMGWEFGIKGNYEFYKSLYLTAGVLEHSNDGGDLGNEANLLFASILMINGGIGINLSNVFSIELDYYFPLQKKQFMKNCAVPLQLQRHIIGSLLILKT